MNILSWDFCFLLHIHSVVVENSIPSVILSIPACYDQGPKVKLTKPWESIQNKGGIMSIKGVVDGIGQLLELMCEFK